MNVLDAAHGIAHEYGCEEMAGRLGIRPKVFNSQVNPNDPTHVLGLMTAVRMQQLANRYDILHSMAETLGFVAIKTPQVGDGEVSSLLAHTCAEFGDYLREVEKAYSDKRVTANEVKRMQKELIELISAATALHSKMESLAKAR